MSERVRPSVVSARTILIGLAVAAFLAAIVLAISIVTGAPVVFNVFVWLAFIALWIAFAAVLFARPKAPDDIWYQTRRLPLVVQGVAWLLFLPVMLGLWIWETAWPSVIRLVLVISLGLWTVYFLFPF